MRLGGFVIHGNNSGTLPKCLKSLKAVCDDVVAIDSESTDGSAALVDAEGIPRMVYPWQGFGAARAYAVQVIKPCDYVLFLDSDEYFEDETIEGLRRWKSSNPNAPGYRLTVNDWVSLESGRFLFRRHRRKRIVRRDFAQWKPEMIVHESLPDVPTEPLPFSIEHQFADSSSLRFNKNDRYALLWAIQAFGRNKPKPVWVQRVGSFLRDAFLTGALFRGGMNGLQTAWITSRYHALKYSYLKAIESGQFAPEISLFKNREFQKLFSHVKDLK